MNQRIALGGTGLSTILGLVLLWGAISAKPVSAIEQMAESIRQAKSYTATIIQESRFAREPGARPVAAKMTGNLYWLAPGSVRMELKGGEFTAGQDNTDIFPAGKPGISIDHKNKTFRRQPARRGHVSPLMILEGLSKYSGQADRELGTKEFNGKQALGFVVQAKNIDPDAYPGSVEIWIDAKSNLPIELCYEFTAEAVPATFRITDLRWNAELDAKLFEPMPPNRYSDATPKPTSEDEQLGRITEALKLYAELSGGHYPRVNMIYGDVTRDEMRRMAGFNRLPTADQFRDERFTKIQQATLGLAAINGILRDNPDAAYHGITVGPKDNDKVLLRWKLDNDRYRVIYGDLRSEVVAARRLHDLEHAE